MTAPVCSSNTKAWMPSRASRSRASSAWGTSEKVATVTRSFTSRRLDHRSCAGDLRERTRRWRQRGSSAFVRVRWLAVARALLRDFVTVCLSIEVEPCPASGMVEDDGRRRSAYASQDARWGNGRDQGEAAPGRGHYKWRQA